MINWNYKVKWYDKKVVVDFLSKKGKGNIYESKTKNKIFR